MSVLQNPSVSSNAPAIIPRPNPADLVRDIRQRLVASKSIDDQTTLLVLAIELLRKEQRQGGAR